MALNSRRAAFGNELSLRQLLILYRWARTRKPHQPLDVRLSIGAQAAKGCLADRVVGGWAER